MKIFFSDLDNTLLYSHRHPITDDKIVAEYLNGKEQSYMRKTTFDLLSQLKTVCFVPVSTRTEKQYRRLICMEALNVKYAIICNGGKLLVDGREDKAWTDETAAAAAPYMSDMELAVNALKEYCGRGEIHRPEAYMCYAAADRPAAVCDEISKYTEAKNTEVYHDQRKVYIFSKGVGKGQAVRRFKKRFHTAYALAAGDSEMDIAMLNEADYALAADTIIKRVTSKKSPLDELDFVLQSVIASLNFNDQGVNDDK